MPLFAVICRDKPDHLSVRLETRAQHLEFLGARDVVRMAGPLLDAGEMRGSLIVIEMGSLEDAQSWAAEDPYKAAGLFETVEVIEWKKVIG